jgi:hypothetical protein
MEVKMKKLFIAAVVSFVVLGSSAWALLPWLSGYVKYYGHDGVGSGKPVYVYLTSPDVDTVYTRSGDEDSWYKYSFNPGTYFNNVMCVFNVGNDYWWGQTVINQTLYGDAQYDITVYYEYR